MGKTDEGSRSEVRRFRNVEHRTSRVDRACRALERLADFLSILLKAVHGVVY
jgi:hypothetical protein